MAAGLQVVMIHAINEALKRGGITSTEQRRKIVADFAGPFSSWLDQCWFADSAGNRVFPCVAFASKGPAVDNDDLGNLNCPSQGFSFGEHLNGNLFFYFEESKEMLRVETGPTQ
jgi:hypothetical protein